MLRATTIAAVSILFATSAFADGKASADETAKIEEALKAWGCGSYESIEKENDPTVAYEIDDVKCKGGEFDVKMDKDFNVVLISRD